MRRMNLGGHEQWHVLLHNSCGDRCLLPFGPDKSHVHGQYFGHNHPFPSSNPLKKPRNRDTIRHYFALFRLKICYCSCPPNLSNCQHTPASIGKNCQKNVRKSCFRPLYRQFFGHFSTFFGHSVDIPFYLGCPAICPSQI